jgi:hypothetical protein
VRFHREALPLLSTIVLTLLLAIIAIVFASPASPSATVTNLLF